MSHEVSIEIVVRCDICQEQMNPVGADGWACWPCKNTLYSGQLHEYPTQVEIRREVDVSQGS